PDTIVEEDTFHKTLAFMDSHPEAGGLGVKMINGKGEFLPESKRSLPTPWVAFYKIFGLSALFPNSKRFGKYHLTYLSPEKTHEVEVLSGAFMLIRKCVLDKIGLLDEDYFMYGEDIDLSYRIILSGYKNYYFADTKIIHYKGESTKKGSLNYVLVFYQAMLIFAQKHLPKQKKSAFMFLIRLAIYFRAGLSIIRRAIDKIWFPTLEFSLLLSVILLIKSLWEHYVKYTDGGEYPEVFSTFIAPIYATIYTIFLGLTGSYRRPFRLRSIFIAIFSGFISIATFSFVFSQWNFSRAIVGLSAVTAIPLTLATRAILNYLQSGHIFFDRKINRKTLLIGELTEIRRVRELMQDWLYNCELIGYVS
ncbi:MAG: glycosyltransferase family 2 protein, partial [Bacteroidia bacterium]|nr:glycosyltransferase family 2 protein [Bacteroidia bacterium]